MAISEYACVCDGNDMVILHLDDGVGIELYSDKDDVALSDEDAEDLASKILDYLADKRAKESNERQELRHERDNDAYENVLEMVRKEKYYEDKYGR